MMHTKRKLRLHGILDKNVEEAILRELKRHDDIARLVWWAGSLSRADLVSSSSTTLRSLIGEKRVAAQLITVDLSSTSSLIESGQFTLYQKVTVTNGLAVLLYMQCLLLLKDAKGTAKRATDPGFSALPCSEFPRSKSRGRKQAVATSFDESNLMRSPIDRRLLKDKKVRLECLDPMMKTPNAYDGFAYNKLIMGVGIYSQYEFDEDNNLRKHMTHIVQWNKPTVSPSVRVVDITDGEKVMPAISDGQPKTCMTDSLHSTGSSHTVNRTGLKLRKVKKTSLETYDDCIVIASDGRIFKKRKAKTHGRLSMEEYIGLHEVEQNASRNTVTLTFHDIDAFLQGKVNLRYRAYFIRQVEKEKSKRQRAPKGEPKGYRAEKKRRAIEDITRSYSLRTSRHTSERASLDSEIYGQIRSICTNGSGTRFKCSLMEWLLGNTRCRHDASVCFLAVLKLASNGMLCLQQVGRDITIEICTP